MLMWHTFSSPASQRLNTWVQRLITSDRRCTRPAARCRQKKRHCGCQLTLRPSAIQSRRVVASARRRARQVGCCFWQDQWWGGDYCLNHFLLWVSTICQLADCFPIANKNRDRWDASRKAASGSGDARGWRLMRKHLPLCGVLHSVSLDRLRLLCSNTLNLIYAEPWKDVLDSDKWRLCLFTQRHWTNNHMHTIE